MKRNLMFKPLGRMEGLTLLETMFALAIGALVLIGAIIFYVSTKQSANASKAAGDMNGIVAGYQSFIAGGNSADGVDLSAIQAAGFLPSPLNDPWAQSYTSTYDAAANELTITIPGIGGVGAPADPTANPPKDAIGGDVNCVAISSLVSSNGASITSIGTKGCIAVYKL